MPSHAGLTNRSPIHSEIDGPVICNDESQASPPNSGAPSGGEAPTGSNQNFVSGSVSLHSRFCFRSTSAKAIQNLESAGIVHQTTPGSAIDSLRIVPLTCNCEAIRRYASNIQNATSDEISFIHLASFVGWSKAEQYAVRMGLTLDRPIRALLKQNASVGL